jgi:hypothetical protein
MAKIEKRATPPQRERIGIAGNPRRRAVADLSDRLARSRGSFLERFHPPIS